jgi:peptidoglycan/xylan/chitin deacetylase (PgdA/CDA1 family)
MTDPPPHIAARRREQRERRRRRRRAGLATVAVAAAVAFVLIGGHGHRPRRGRHVFVAETSKPRLGRAHGLAAVMAAGNAEIRRLVVVGLPLYCGGHRGNEVAFTFDDGPGVYTHLALKKLHQAHERATFFVVGKSINAWPGYLPREVRVAALGDHTYTHPDLVAVSPAEVTSQLVRAAELIKAKSGQQVDMWRPPYEASDATVARIARRLGLLEVLWSVDSRDSLGANWAQIIQLVEAGLRPGAIVELHENRGQTIRALTTLLPYLHRRHLRSVSIPELLASDPPSLAQLRRGSFGCDEHAAPGAGVGVGVGVE